MTKEINELLSLKNSIETMDFKVLNANELMIIMDDSYVEECNGNSTFIGFHYFSPKCLLDTSKNSRFIVCIVNENEISGVLKISEYDNYRKPYVGLDYIDVHEKFRRKGVAKGLYNLLNSYLPKDTLFISSPLSKMGKQANLDRLRKNIVTNFITYDNKNDYLLCSMYEFYQTS